MPYAWTTDPDDPTRRSLRLWPHRSLTPGGFVTFFAASALLLTLPILALLGQPALWFVLAFAALALWGAWRAIIRNSAEARRGEHLSLTRDRITLTHDLKPGPPLIWEANPYWVTIHIRPEGGPVADYLTLKGNGREVELGAFLAPEERRALADDLGDRLAALR
ncbi:DUF2244 domain-containing protein [Frigidibacter sp. RF13]|uniref:DUF2244 domain-containing protein n=1 Tax=Frigidibacter sp. RF13 TaxID=2997340 RepID=UPI0022706D6C|nr:DUF2244 domain-containing protein [Frigidibacter sp. RF13]MCY1127568.1 DUF2244 domain-containing protein [Frigidibacter sp. RF13]